jgi:biopolymer transport protein ExbD
VKKRPKKLFVRPALRPAGDINVTPLVDVVLVLLIIFMVVTPLLEKDIIVQVPSTENVVDVSDLPPDQLVVRVDAAGTLKINADPVSHEEYVERLRARLAPKATAQKIVFVVAEDEVSYGIVVSALDGAKKAGAVTLGMATDDPTSRL